MVTKKKAVKKAPLSNNKLHVVLGDNLMDRYIRSCADLGKDGMSKSEVGRLLIEGFVDGAIKITPPKVTQKKAIRA